jgi:hypothetical protein
MLDLFRNISHYTHELSQKQLKNKSKDAANIEILIDVDKLPQYTNMSLFTLTHDDGMHHTHLERDEGESKKAGKDVVKMNSQALTSQSDIAKQVSQHLQNLVTQDTNAYKSKDSEINTLFQICSSVLGTVLQANKKLSDNL